MKTEIIHVKDLKVGDRIIMIKNGQVKPNWTAEVIIFEPTIFDDYKYIEVKASNRSEGWIQDGMGSKDCVKSIGFDNSVLVEWDNNQSRPNSGSNVLQ